MDTFNKQLEDYLQSKIGEIYLVKQIIQDVKEMEEYTDFQKNFQRLHNEYFCSQHK